MHVQTHDEAMSYRRQNRTTAVLALCTLAWLATLAAARFGPSFLWHDQPVASWIAVGVNILVGVAWIIAFARFLRAQDELWRKITQDALAVTLGVGWVAGFAYVVADAAGIIGYEVGIALFAALLGIVYLIAVSVGWIRYR
jgi:hypothetical protein